MLCRTLFVALLSCACLLPASAQTLVTDITVPGMPNGIAVNPNNNRIYVAIPATTSSDAPEVAVIDGYTNSIIDEVSVPTGVQFVAVNLSTGFVYATGCIYPANRCSVSVINGATDEITTTIPIDGTEGIGVQGIAVDPILNRIYVADDNTNQLVVINGVTNQTLYVYDVNAELLGMAVDFGTHQLLAAPSGSVLDLFNGTTYKESQIRVGFINQDVAVNSYTSLAYVTNNAGNTLGIVNLKTFTASSILIGNVPYGVSVDYLSNLIFVSIGTGEVVELNGSTNTKTGGVYAPSSYLDVNPVTRTVYASSQEVGETAVHVISE